MWLSLGWHKPSTHQLLSPHLVPSRAGPEEKKPNLLGVAQYMVTLHFLASVLGNSNALLSLKNSLHWISESQRAPGLNLYLLWLYFSLRVIGLSLRQSVFDWRKLMAEHWDQLVSPRVPRLPDMRYPLGGHSILKGQPSCSIPKLFTIQLKIRLNFNERHYLCAISWAAAQVDIRPEEGHNSPNVLMVSNSLITQFLSRVQMPETDPKPSDL